MQFGVTFYPDQYPKETWEKEFQNIRAAGFGIVRFGEMAWDWIEPKEGDWKFEGLDHALALCEKHKLKVVLGIPVAQAPQWLIRKYPEILHVAHDGHVHPPYGPRPNACRDNDTYRKYAETLTRVLAERYSKHPALEMWQIDNEPCYPPLDLTHNKDYCHCDATSRAFAEWAKDQYKTIEKLNNAWGTKFWTGTFSTFSEITPPRCGMWDAGNPHIWLDWYRFKSESLSRWLNNLRSIIMEYDREHLIGTNGFTTIANRSVDHTVIARGMEWFGWDIYPKGTQNSEESFAQIADYWRSVCESAGAEFIVSELQGGPNVRWGNGGWVKGEEIEKWAELLVRHGAKRILIHNWRPPLYGSESGGFGLTKPDGTPTERLGAVKNIIDRTRKTHDAKRSGIAIYFSRSSELQTYQEEGPSRPCPPSWFSGRGDLGLFYGSNSIAGAYRLLWDGKSTHDFIFEEDLSAGKIKHRAILLTNPYLLSRKQMENLQAYILSGGVVVTESRFGLKDPHAHLYPRPLLEELLGAEHQYTEIIDDKIGFSKLDAFAFGFRDIVKIKDGRSKAVLKYKDGNPALIERKMGNGKLLYATFSLFPSLLKWENKKLLERMKNALRILRSREQ
ncbi:MAG TPA: beta-galactosidase [Candidatus Omnitrophota bacterium]|nr:beta-galactosidase [Candidatus Omnitrophota bacterium]